MTQIAEVIHGHVASHIFDDDGIFPNNPNLPALVYKGALHLHPGDEASVIAALFRQNHWTNPWEDGVYTYHHYHSTTHEVIGVFCGYATIQLGGPEGVCVEVYRSDVIIIPAGVAHKNIKNSEDFLCVGAYPNGSEYDMNDENPDKRETAIKNISIVPVPALDPVFGSNGPLQEYWTT